MSDENIIIKEDKVFEQVHGGKTGMGTLILTSNNLIFENYPNAIYTFIQNNIRFYISKGKKEPFQIPLSQIQEIKNITAKDLFYDAVHGKSVSVLKIRAKLTLNDAICPFCWGHVKKEMEGGAEYFKCERCNKTLKSTTKTKGVYSSLLSELEKGDETEIEYFFFPQEPSTWVEKIQKAVNNIKK
jgi:hypothetical protein